MSASGVAGGGDADGGRRGGAGLRGGFARLERMVEAGEVWERVLLPLVREKVDRIDWGGDRAEMPAPAVDRGELEARRVRVLDNYEDGLITREQRTVTPVPRAGTIAGWAA